MPQLIGAKEQRPRVIVPTPNLLFARVTGYDASKPDPQKLAIQPMPKFFILGMVFLGILDPFNIICPYKCVVDAENPSGMALAPMASRWFADWSEADKVELRELFAKEFAGTKEPSPEPEEPKECKPELQLGASSAQSDAE